ncbi:MAG TPA: hypothetical protein DHU75_03440 [Rikenellaceae bacterium]|nr:hypothetical protein [Rikenellaceae bacterium]
MEGSASNEKFDLAKTYSCPKKGVHYIYGHALLYVLNGGNHAGASHDFVGRFDINLGLRPFILLARRNAVWNYKD